MQTAKIVYAGMTVALGLSLTRNLVGNLSRDCDALAFFGHSLMADDAFQTQLNPPKHKMEKRFDPRTGEPVGPARVVVKLEEVVYIFDGKYRNIVKTVLRLRKNLRTRFKTEDIGVSVFDPDTQLVWDIPEDEEEFGYGVMASSVGSMEIIVHISSSKISPELYELMRKVGAELNDIIDSTRPEFWEHAERFSDPEIITHLSYH